MEAFALLFVISFCIGSAYLWVRTLAMWKEDARRENENKCIACGIPQMENAIRSSIKDKELADRLVEFNNKRLGFD